MDLYLVAKELRKNMTKAEIILWKKLSNRKILDYKFRRQAVINGLYIADFYCHSKKLIIEVDGLIHLLKPVKENDNHRTKVLESLGYKVIRFDNEEILNSTAIVIARILRELNSI